jgi:hypothetical protein
MRRLLILAIGLLIVGAWLCTFSGAVRPVKAQFNGCPAGFCNGPSGSGGGGGGTATFDPANVGAAGSLSGGNLTFNMGASGPASGYSLARSLTSHSSGACYFELTITNNNGGAGNVAVGTVNASSPLTVVDAGFDVNLSAAAYGNASGWFINSTATGTGSPTYGQDNLGIAINFGTKLIWLRDITVSSTTWNGGGGADPVGGSGGNSISAITGPYFAAAWFNNAVGVKSLTANFGALPFGASAPGGYGNC